MGACRRTPCKDDVMDEPQATRMSPEAKDRPCMNPECRKTFWSTGYGHRYCDKCREAMDREPRASGFRVCDRRRKGFVGDQS